MDSVAQGGSFVGASAERQGCVMMVNDGCGGKVDTVNRVGLAGAGGRIAQGIRAEIPEAKEQGKAVKG